MRCDFIQLTGSFRNERHAKGMRRIFESSSMFILLERDTSLSYSWNVFDGESQ